MWSTPFVICSRIAVTNPYGPSHSRAWPEVRKWPPVVVRKWPAAKRRGPTYCPEANARFQATSMKWAAPAHRNPTIPLSVSASIRRWPKSAVCSAIEAPVPAR